MLWVRVINALYGRNGGWGRDQSYGYKIGRVLGSIIKLGNDIDGVGLVFSNSFGKEVKNGMDTFLGRVVGWPEGWFLKINFLDFLIRKYTYYGFITLLNMYRETRSSSAFISSDNCIVLVTYGYRNASDDFTFLFLPCKWIYIFYSSTFFFLAFLHLYILFPLFLNWFKNTDMLAWFLLFN